MKNTIKYIFIVIIVILTIGCSTTKFVPKDKYLLADVNLEIDDKRVSKSIAETYTKQHENSRFLGLIPFKLWFYNLSGRDSTKKINRVIRNLGQSPVIYDSIQTQRSIVQLRRFMENKGFYDAEVSAKENFNERKVRVKYKINANEPKTINKIHFSKDSLVSTFTGRDNIKIELADSTEVRNLLLENKGKSLLLDQDLLDVDVLKEERERLENFYHKRGFYNLDVDNIHFYLDTTKIDNETDIYYGIRNTDSLKIKKFKINNISVYLDIDGIVQDDEESLDSIRYDNITFYFKDKMTYKPNILSRAIVLKENELYNVEHIQQTKSRLAILQQFRYTNITFNVVPKSDSIGLLNCVIQLASQKKQSYGIEATATVNSGDFGFATNLRYQHKNLFRGAELFTVQFSAGIERLSGNDSSNKFDASEYGTTLNLISPKFYLPFFKVENWRARAPRTSLSIVYNYAERPEYRRTITDLTFSYQWKSNDHFTHVLTPLDLGLLKVNADSTFLSNLNNFYRQTSYVDHIIPSLRYSLRFNNQGKTRKITYQRARFNIETSGNVLNSIDNLIDRGDKKEDVAQEGYYSYFGIRYAQFVRSDIEFTYNQYINYKHALIYHAFIGAGFPYGNSNVMPFEKMYFSGGPNSMRAWQPRSLGPGSSKVNDPSLRLSYGELKLEGNLEYRFNLDKNFEGALFVDIGNVWNLSDLANKDPNSKFKLDRFYKQIAVGSGLGIRYNFSNIILRLDAGVKIIDPYYGDEKFVPKYGGYKLKDVSFNFGIGYPF